MAVVRTAHPYWIERTVAREIPRRDPLRGDLRVDVAIIGGGITGATISWTLSAAGLSVAMVEAQRIGRGSTVASTALLMQEPDEDLLALTERYGFASARRIWQLSRGANDGFIALIKKLHISCELNPKDSVYFTLDQPSRLRRELRLRRRAKLESHWLEEAELLRLANIHGCGIRTPGNAQVDPYKACLGLVEAASARGTRVFEETPALRVEGRTGRMSVHTPGGRVLADTVVVATGFATAEFKPLLARFRMRHTYVLVTPRLRPRVRREIGLSEVMLWDTDRPYHYARWTTDHRLMLGGGDRPRAHGRLRRRAFREGTREVHDFFVRLYPALADVAFDYAWEGLFATTPDGLPYVGPHRRYPGHLFALGYGGNGMTFSFLAASLIHDRLLGRVSRDHELFAFGRMRQASVQGR
jgi:glycine/D-amino acid oxidase-like deaminating enzyme